jgi:hypothetical protein
MVKYNPETREQIIKLKDGRTIFKTHNGFRCFMESKKGLVIPIEDEYYKKAKSNKQ